MEKRIVIVLRTSPIDPNDVGAPDIQRAFELYGQLILEGANLNLRDHGYREIELQVSCEVVGV